MTQMLGPSEALVGPREWWLSFRPRKDAIEQIRAWTRNIDWTLIQCIFWCNSSILGIVGIHESALSSKPAQVYQFYHLVTSDRPKSFFIILLARVRCFNRPKTTCVGHSRIFDAFCPTFLPWTERVGDNQSSEILWHHCIGIDREASWITNFLFQLFFLEQSVQQWGRSGDLERIL